jgi:NADH-quinone oxidoreductase subunit J
VSAVLFFIAGIGAIAGAVGVVSLRDPFYSVLALVGHLISLALLFLLLRSEFVAAVQVVVYAGAVMVLYVFVVAYVGDEGSSLGARLRPSGGPASLRLGGALAAGALLVELFIALLGTGLKAIDGKGAGYRVGGPKSEAFGTPAYIGKLLLTRFLLVFEVSSFLLLIAAVGAVVLARRRGGLDDPDRDRLLPLHLLRPRGTGTMAEGVGSLAFATAHDRPEEFQVQKTSQGTREPAAAGAPAAASPSPAGATGTAAPNEPARATSQEGGW